jgi:hypothetical protein
MDITKRIKKSKKQYLCLTRAAVSAGMKREKDRA